MVDAGIRILCVHQGGELYGSDRSFLQAVQALRQGWPEAHIRIILAADGPLRALLEQVADQIVVRDLCVLRLANPISTAFKCSLGLPWYLALAIHDIGKADLVYINTTVIADFMIAARVAPRKSVIHAREIPKKKAMPVVRMLTLTSGARVIFNSRATADAFSMPANRAHAVIHNGVDAVPDATTPALPRVFSSERPLKIAMLGRINDWKGQDLLIKALALLSKAERACVRVRIVGSTFQDAIEPIRVLEAQISGHDLKEVVNLEPFRDDPNEVYRWADLCVVPSKLPEPFGRVAIEAMAHARPVIAAAHGGLIEIVEDPGSGWLVAPNDSAALARAIVEALADPAELSKRAIGALARFSVAFSSQTMALRLRVVLKGWIGKLV